VDSQALQIRLPDGRRLGYAEIGDPQGIPVMYQHGFPASRLEALLVERHARDLGVRLIAADRPGFGLSDPSPDRSLLDWPADLICLADQLGLRHFAVLGVSGGGPAALACAAQLQERLTAVTIVCGLGPVAEPALLQIMHWPARFSFGLSQKFPKLARILFGKLVGPLLGHCPDLTLRLLNVASPAVDAAILDVADIRSILAENIREAFHQGGGGPALELALSASPWPFSLAGIDLPIHFWHGGLDQTVPSSHTEYLAAQIQNACCHIFPREGHFSLPIRHAESILKSLLTCHRERTDG